MLSYLGPMCSSVGLVLAGFHKDGSDHVVAWQHVEPPQELQKLIFPWVEAEEAKVAAVSFYMLLVAGLHVMGGYVRLMLMA